MKNDATDLGVSDELDVELEEEVIEVEGEEAEEVVLSDRERIFAQAEESRRNDLREEGVELEGPPVEAAEEEDLEEELSTIEVKVDGVATTATEDEINERLGTEGKIDQRKIADYQKHLTADKRLEKAASDQKANERKAAELAQREAELAVLRATPAGEAPAEINPEMVSRLNDAFLTEDHAEASKILSEIMNHARGPAQTQPSEHDINNAVERTLAAREYKIDLKKGQEEVKEKYKHLIGDPMLQKAIDARAAEIFEEDRNKPASKILLEAAESVHQSVLSATGTKQKSREDLIKDKKRAAARHSAPAGGTKKATTAAEQATPSTGSVVTSMVESRNAKLAGRAA